MFTITWSCYPNGMQIHNSSNATAPPSLSQTPATFGERNFGSCPLGHQRRTRRLGQLAEALGDHPAGPLTPQATLQALRGPPAVRLLRHDTTALAYSGRTAGAARGQSGHGHGPGCACPHRLAADPVTGRL